METVTIQVENLKCGGCENTIRIKLTQLNNVQHVRINPETSEITVEYDKTLEDTKSLIENKLAQLGYPKKGTGNGFQKAKSYVSCAVGKISNKIES